MPSNQFICLSHAPWRAMPTRTQHLMLRLKGAHILYFEPPGPNWRRPGRRLRPGLTLYTLPPLAEVEECYHFFFRRRYRRLARFITQRMDRHRFREPVLWTDTPESVHLLEFLSYRALIYDCDRAWSHLPIRWESDLALSADVIFAASQGLMDHLSPCSDNIALLPNGVNYPMFAQTGLPCPPELRDISGPVLGYVGTLWRDLDLAPALLCAQYMPRWTFVFLGRREHNPALEPLSRLPNVRILGPCEPGEVPDYLSRFDVCMSFPRQRDPDNDVVPTHIYEYFAAGKPVVAFYRRGQVEPFPDVIYAAYTAREFARLCRQALSEAGDWLQARRRSRGQEAAWSRRAEQVQQILETVGLCEANFL